MKKQLSLLVNALFNLKSTTKVSHTVNVTTAGKLSILASTYLNTVTNLTVTGNIDVRDIKTIRDKIPKLAVLDISGVSIVAYTGTAGTAGTSSTSYPANEMPIFSFYNTFTGGKTSLKTITLPKPLISILNSAFMGCSGITGSLTIPNSVTTIGRDAFNGCSKISRLILGNSVTTLGDYAFYGCRGIKSIYCLNPVPPTLGSDCFTIASHFFGQKFFIDSCNATDVFVSTDIAVTAYKASCWHSHFPGEIIKTGATGTVNDLSINIFKSIPPQVV